MTTSLAQLLVQATKEVIYSTALGVATAIGLPVTSWNAGDPTRSLYHVEAEELSALESMVVGFISSGFLDYAHGTWLKVLAKQVFNVEVPDPTYATTTLTLTNSGGGVYDIEAGDLTVKNTVSGMTYHNTTGGHLAASPGTLDITVIADEPGSDSSAGAGEIDDLVTGLLGVTCSNATAAIGIDEQDEATTIVQCRDKLGALSPNGPAEAFAYVARNSTLTGTTGVTKVRVYPNSSDGVVQVFLAGPSGGVSSGDRDLVEAAIATWATPLCITPSVAAASNVTVAVTYTLWIYRSCNKTTGEIEAAVQAALEALFASPTRCPIGGDIIAPASSGNMYKSLIETAIHATFPQVFRVTVAAPAGDTALANSEVAVLGAVTPTINLEEDP